LRKDINFVKMVSFARQDELKFLSNKVNRLEELCNSTLKPYLSFFQEIEKSMKELKINKHDISGELSTSLNEALMNLDKNYLKTLAVGDLVWAKYPPYQVDEKKDKWFRAKVVNLKYAKAIKVMDEHPNMTKGKNGNSKKRKMAAFPSVMQLVACLDYGEGHTHDYVLEDEILACHETKSKDEKLGKWSNCVPLDTVDKITFPTETKLPFQIGTKVLLLGKDVKDGEDIGTVKAIYKSKRYNITADKNSAKYYSVDSCALKPALESTEVKTEDTASISGYSSSNSYYGYAPTGYGTSSAFGQPSSSANSSAGISLTKDKAKDSTTSDSPKKETSYQIGERILLKYPTWNLWYHGKVTAVLYEISADIEINGHIKRVPVSDFTTDLTKRKKEQQSNPSEKSKSPSNDVEELKVGDEVEGNYQNIGLWYPGKVNRVYPENGPGQGPKYDIFYRDGDKEYCVTSDRIRKPQLNFEVGQTCEVRRKDKLYYICKITKLDKTTVDVEYDSKYSFTEKKEANVERWRLRERNDISISLTIGNIKKRKNQTSSNNSSSSGPPLPVDIVVDGPSIVFANQFEEKS